MKQISLPSLISKVLIVAFAVSFFAAAAQAKIVIKKSTPPAYVLIVPTNQQVVSR